jgi:hypothetical protein
LHGGLIAMFRSRLAERSLGFALGLEPGFGELLTFTILILAKVEYISPTLGVPRGSSVW